MRGDRRPIYLGGGPDGIALEVIAVEVDGGELWVIHAMPLRRRYLKVYEEINGGG